ncbi:MAG TPA: hypothetical protein ENN29_01295 [Candidatus Hydrogenedentes bacterium]|nr:hypothetical protein [Candidatus Hydrogenedentota bacterium]
MIPVTCSQCGLSIFVPPEVQGREGICFRCGLPLIIPSEAGRSRHDNLNYERGDRIADRYVVKEQIGKGGMGVVYRALDTLVQDMVALKFLHPNILRTEQGRQLFIREVQIARRLRHENIVAVHDVSWTAEGILYLSMEFAQGHSLRALLRRYRHERRVIPVRLAVTYLRQILVALDYAHHTVIHRDIKPENVMVMPNERVKVLDFGLAKAAHEEYFQEGDEEKTSRMVGTWAYAAPEQRKRQKVDLRADVYAVGLLMHELLTLRTPLDDPVEVVDVRHDVSPSLISVLERALAVEKEQRWPSAKDFRIALETAFEESYRKTVAVFDSDGMVKTPSTKGMVFLEGGHFLMGNNEVREEAPEHEVLVRPFWMDAYPVTNKQYQEYLEETGAPAPRFWHDPQYNGPNQPVTGVSWAEAKAYAAWAGKTLPTEGQWEFAARGRENRKYPWGNLPPDATLANFNDNLGMPSVVTMHEDGGTPEGIYDLAGNVYEWMLDPFVSYTAKRQNPQFAAAAPRRALRGGSYKSPPNELLCTARKGLFPEVRENTIGFRCVIPASRLIHAQPANTNSDAPAENASE